MAKRPMTITEKIFAKHAGLESVKAGDLITAKVDITLANDITGPVAIKEFKKIGAEKVFDKTRTVFVPDHFVPNKDIKSAEQAKYIREFVKEFIRFHNSYWRGNCKTGKTNYWQDSSTGNQKSWN